MFRDFQPFMDYKKLIDMQANGICYRMDKGKQMKLQNRSVKPRVNTLKIGKK